MTDDEKDYAKAECLRQYMGGHYAKADAVKELQRLGYTARQAEDMLASRKVKVPSIWGDTDFAYAGG